MAWCVQARPISRRGRIPVGDEEKEAADAPSHFFPNQKSSIVNAV
jgi:hypothetical protein